MTPPGDPDGATTIGVAPSGMWTQGVRRRPTRACNMRLGCSPFAGGMTEHGPRPEGPWRLASTLRGSTAGQDEVAARPVVKDDPREPEESEPSSVLENGIPIVSRHP